LETWLNVPLEALAPDLLVVTQPLALHRRGVETRLIAGAREPSPDPVLLRSLARRGQGCGSSRPGPHLRTWRAAPVARNPAYVPARPLAFLSPKLQCRIIDGRQAPGLTVARLIRETIPEDRRAQEDRFGAT
jgi:hypothetical protein